MVDPDAAGDAQSALADVVEDSAFTDRALTVEAAEFPFLSLYRWQRDLSDLVADPSVVMSDIDERTGHLVFGVTDEAASSRLPEFLGAAGVPLGAVRFRPMRRLITMASVRDQFRPTFGGIQIQRGNQYCTLGVNGGNSGKNVFVTAGHCSTNWGATDGSEYHQHISINKIAEEISEAAFFGHSTDTRCPSSVGNKCRYEDSSINEYVGSVSSERKIAETTYIGSWPSTGSLTLTSDSTKAVVNEVGNPISGVTYSKIGRTTGWTSGPTVATCATYKIWNPNILDHRWFICQYELEMRTDPGDSGSPVFSYNSTSAAIHGIIIAGDSFITSILSPWSAIEAAYGGIDAT
jgi:hypothetical protein